MDDATRRKVCQLVAGLVVSDSELDEREDSFLERTLSQFGIPLEDREAVIFPLLDAEEAAREIAALSPGVQRQALKLLVEAAAADGEIAPEEREYLAAVATALGVSERQLDVQIKLTLSA